MRARCASLFMMWLLSAWGAQADWPTLYDPFRVRTLYLQMEAGSSWGAVVSDSDFNSPQNALFWMEGETPIPVTVKRKSDPAIGQKVSVKIDVNARAPGTEWHGVEKLSLENGAEGGLVKEGFAWQMHRMASEAGFYNYPAAYAAWVRLVVDGQLIGVYTSVEERDDQMLKNRGMWKPGVTWLYKNDPSPSLEEGSGNSPTFTHLCYSPFKTRNACGQPINFEADLVNWIDMQSMLTLGAIEAFTGNGDGLFTHDGKNHFFADFAPPTELKRVYFPWDLDTGVSDVNFPISGSAGAYQTQILGHPWFRQWFLHLMSDLLDGPLSTEALTAFLNELEPVLTPALLEDPNSSMEGDPAGHFQSLREWVTNRIANVRGQIGPVIGAPVFSPPPGEIVSGFELTLQHSNAQGTIYFTLDGSDPRAIGGGIAGTAYTQPLVLNDSVSVLARVREGTNWSALRRGVFNVANHARAIKVTEIMYQPKALSPGEDGGQFEFIELQNRSTTPVNLSGCTFEGIDYAFKPGTIIAASNFVLLVRNAVAFTNRYPGVAYHGIYWGGLDKDGEKLRLKNSDGNNVFSVEYNDAPPWPLGANGFGWSLVNQNPEADPDDWANWRASRNAAGSPGAPDGLPSYDVGIVISEVLAHTDPPLEDAIELHNPTANPIDVSGWWLSDQIENTIPELLWKFRIPNGTVIAAGGHRVFYERDFNSGFAPFALSSLGDQVYLASADSAGELTGYITGAEFGASDNGVSFRRMATSDGIDYAAAAALSLGAASAPPKIGPVVINEIMFHPTNAGHEFIELLNVSQNWVDLSGWTMRGANYVFPNGTFVPSGSFLVLAGSTNISAAEFRSRYQVPSAVPVLTESFDLDNSGEALELLKPNDSPTNAPILVDRVRYNDKGLWSREADGHGPSLERIAPDVYGNETRNWRAGKSGGTPGRPNELSRITAIAPGSKWKMNALGRNLGQAWRGTNYSDSGWLSSNASITVANPPVTTCLRKSIVIHDELTAISNLLFSVSYDDAFVAYLNGTEVARRKLPSGEVSYLTLASSAAGGTSEVLDLTAFKTALRRGANTVAVEVHQPHTNDNMMTWDGELTYTMGRVSSQPRFTEIFVQNDNTLVLRWTSVTGESYRLHRSSDLRNWVSLEGVVPASGDVTQFTVSRTGLVEFFRVSVEP
jgi:hypothetical protein